MHFRIPTKEVMRLVKMFITVEFPQMIKKADIVSTCIIRFVFINIADIASISILWQTQNDTCE
ncbi:hypothetical protein C9994_11585 [Marivirga lumbricoides]|uniref:Uncharacterized protein n=1 Tax=Marivirga lumbricoides TaxID=1046115 RepID=A0A2T4DML6_9BACT|nr:hypothetical protein C9994_11585 [Marivirga lumbricoides]